MLDYLTEYSITCGTKILAYYDIVDYLCKNTFRRNTKESVEKEHTLPPIKEEVHLLNFSATERMMYNAYIANPINNKFSVYLRQLCCHPKLADETKHLLSECNTLEDIEKMMTAHYKKEMDLARKKFVDNVLRIRKIKRNIKRSELTKKKKSLRTILGKNKWETTLVDILEPDEISDDEHDDIEDPETLEEEYNIDQQLREEKRKSFKKAQIKNLHTAIGIYNKERKKGTSGVGELAKDEDTITLENLKLSLVSAQEKNILLGKELQGKTTTFTFYNNVVAKIRKTADKEIVIKSNKKEYNPDDDIMAFLDDSDSDEEDGGDQDDEICGVCLGEIAGDNIGVTKCGHIFHYSCLMSAITKTRKCPYCNTPLNKNQIFKLSYNQKPKKEVAPTAEQKEKNILINDIGTKLANLVWFLRSSDKHSIIFSQWDDLLHRVGKELKKYGIKNVFCKGNAFQRDKAIREFNEDDKIKVIMLSSEKAASGTNLTKAGQIILLDPVYGEYDYRKDTENQAIGRAHRIGQKEKITVVRFIIKDTVEEQIYKMNKQEEQKLKIVVDRKEHVYK
jgi:SNF2 family DNA or RNA helicase